MTVLEIVRSAMGMPPAKPAPEAKEEPGLNLRQATPLVAAPTREELQALENRAAEGEADAQFKLSMLYYRGKGVRRDAAECLLWLTLSAEQGHPQAMADYGIIIQGLEPEDILEAREILDEFTGPRNILMPEFQPPEVDPRSLATSRPSEAGSDAERKERRKSYQPANRVPLATMINVAGNRLPPRRSARVLIWGILVVVLGTAAGLWMFVVNAPKPAKSATQTRATNAAPESLAALLPELPSEITTSMDLTHFAQIREAAEKGDRMAEFSIGLAYAKGVGVPKDLEAAHKWYVKAAEQDYGNAQNNLGVMYVTGNGVPLDYVQGYKWFFLASRSVKGAVQNRNQLAAIMTAAQLATALREANAAVSKLTSNVPAVGRIPSGIPPTNESGRN